MSNVEKSEPLVFDPKRPRGLRGRRVFIGPIVRHLDTQRARRIIEEVDLRLASRTPPENDPPPAA